MRVEVKALDKQDAKKSVIDTKDCLDHLPTNNYLLVGLPKLHLANWRKNLLQLQFFSFAKKGKSFYVLHSMIGLKRK
jgi:hypothetical protein